MRIPRFKSSSSFSFKVQHWYYLLHDIMHECPKQYESTLIRNSTDSFTKITVEFWAQPCTVNWGAEMKKAHFYPSKEPSHISFPSGSDSKESACNAGDLGSIPGLGRSPGEGNGYSLKYSCLENSTDRNLAGYSPWGWKEADMTEPLTLSLSQYY